MSVTQKLRNEIRSLGLTTMFFASWFAILVFLKWLILAEYNIAFSDVSIVIIGALIVAKVVLVLENVPIDTWAKNRSAIVHVLARTALYGFGILIVLLLEKAFEARHEYGGFFPALTQVFRHNEIHHVLAATIGVTGALLVFNAMLVIHRQLGGRGLLDLFMSPLAEKKENGS
jgi:hypothetical protein